MDVCSDYGTPSKNVETDAETAEPGTNEKDSDHTSYLSFFYTGKIFGE